MSLRSKAWIVATTVGAVEAMKDQGFARWNYTIRSLHQHANSNFKSCDLPKKISFPAANVSNRATQDKAKRAEESWRKAMFLSCWGPN